MIGIRSDKKTTSFHSSLETHRILDSRCEHSWFEKNEPVKCSEKAQYFLYIYSGDDPSEYGLFKLCKKCVGEYKKLYQDSYGYSYEFSINISNSFFTESDTIFP